ncbi:hypothetical protein [Streptomyces sp. NBC_00057]
MRVWRLRLTQPQVTQVWADRGYAADLVDRARAGPALPLGNRAGHRL